MISFALRWAEGGICLTGAVVCLKQGRRLVKRKLVVTTHQFPNYLQLLLALQLNATIMPGPSANLVSFNPPFGEEQAPPGGHIWVIPGDRVRLIGNRSTLRCQQGATPTIVITPNIAFVSQSSPTQPTYSYFRHSKPRPDVQEVILGLL